MECISVFLAPWHFANGDETVRGRSIQLCCKSVLTLKQKALYREAQTSVPGLFSTRYEELQRDA